jgi:hypothetical protein
MVEGRIPDRAPMARPIGQVRVLKDALHAQWLVYEVAYEFDRRSGRSLIFDGDVVWRRVRDYPADWADQSDDELLVILGSV